MGLAQRIIEQAGITTVALSNIPALTAAVGVPRLVAVEHPFGLVMGAPGDSDRQRCVLQGLLEAAGGMRLPGEVRHLPFTWSGGYSSAPAPPPIAEYLKRHPWQLPKLFAREIPRNFK